MLEPGFWVLHVAGLDDREALAALSRTTQVIARLGVRQVLLALRDWRGTDATWWRASIAAEVMQLPCDGLSVVPRIRALQSEFARLLRERSLYAVHLHGFMPCLLGTRALKGAMLQVRVVCSPHPGQFGSPWIAALAGRLLRSHLSPFHYAPLTTSPTEAQALSKLLNRSAEVLPQPVAEPFFAVARHEAFPPTVLAEGAGARAVNVVSRLAVLLNSRDARVRFSWLGTVQGRPAAQLEAAKITVCGAGDDDKRALSLSCAWMFIEMSDRHLSDRHLFPVGVAQAMAAGVPCLVSDIPAHRALIRHGETGFVYTSERDLLEKVVVLLRDGEERRRIGQAARAEAARRFTEENFQRVLLRAYGFLRENPAIEARAPATD
jgi:glycosyltransferase involved in cell wall biosynthesis